MKDFILKNKLLLILFSITIVLIINLFSISFGMEEYKETDFSLGKVNTELLNLRSGPSTSFESISMLKRNEYLRVYAQIGDWYVVQNDKNLIGAVHSKYIDKCLDEKAPVSSSEEIIETSANLVNDSKEINFEMSESETKLLNLINEERKKNNLSELQIDEELQNIARLKAQDLVENNYFSHISPSFGTPFEMLKNNGINYKTASENIAGNSSLEGAVSSWMNSEDHKKNILSNEFNYTGLAVVDSLAYGNIVVEFFVGR
ncbi:MAG: SH3 domain-containing protein [Clostridia bacterium]|nr:SH3 domain-containing protein [Clostridia bacterium]